MVSARLLSVLLLAILLIPSIATAEAKIEIYNASPSFGIVGSIKDANAQLFFESRLIETTLRAEIRGADSRQYWLYVEDLLSSEPPRVVIDGMEFTGQYGPDVQATLQRLGASPEGALIRTLAFDLGSLAPRRDLAAYRRGILTAFQAMQRGYAAELRQLPSPPDRKKIMVVDPETAQPSVVEANGRQTDDYLFSKEGGFVVKTQHPKAVFSNNFLSDDHELVHRSIGRLPIKPMDDSNIGGGCFGMCGKGCTNDWSCRGFKGWSHEWIAGPYSSTSALCYCNVPQQFIDPDCSNFTWGSFKVTTYATTGTAVHTITGWSSPGCVAHDWCCRNVWFGCANPVCYSPGLQAQLECALGIGWEVSWSYVGPYGWQYATYENTMCRWDCPDCGSGIFPDPIEVDP